MQLHVTTMVLRYAKEYGVLWEPSRFEKVGDSFSYWVNASLGLAQYSGFGIGPRKAMAEVEAYVAVLRSMIADGFVIKGVEGLLVVGEEGYVFAGQNQETVKAKAFEKGLGYLHAPKNIGYPGALEQFAHALRLERPHYISVGPGSAGWETQASITLPDRTVITSEKHSAPSKKASRRAAAYDVTMRIIQHYKQQ